MYGKEHLEWTEEQAVAEKIDTFLASLSNEDRVYAMAILRKRHTVYKDNPLSRLGAGVGATPFSPPTARDLQRNASLLNPNVCVGGSVVADIFGF